MVRYGPGDWPERVQPPGSDGWEATAVAWLLDLVPEYRQYKTVCRHPVILASIARHIIHGSIEGAHDGYRAVRTELAEHAPPHAVDAALEAYRAEGFRLAATERAIELVERACAVKSSGPASKCLTGCLEGCSDRSAADLRPGRDTNARLTLRRSSAGPC